MTLEEFNISLSNTTPPPGINKLLEALWYEAKGNWDACHQIIQDLDSPDASQIHAYLHRKEGDQWNADYWYRRAGNTKPDKSLAEELNSLIKKHL